MRRSDRLLGIILSLRAGRIITAPELARQFEVSQRTIYRDVETLSVLGIPVYAEQGRRGGFRLLDGYFLPAISFSQEEAISLVLGLTVLERMRSRPFASSLDTASAKLLAAMPRAISARLADAATFLGAEGSAEAAFHRELTEAPLPASATAAEQNAIDTFLQALLDGANVDIEYRSPYRSATDRLSATPLGLFWDRDRWYLSGDRIEPSFGRRLWRADRVLAIRPIGSGGMKARFDVRDLMGRTWLAHAMRHWSNEAPVRIRVSAAQAALLRSDWYYCHADYQQQVDGGFIVSFGQDRQDVVVELLRWLGPGAELLEPREWRQALRDDLLQMLGMYDDHRNI